MEDTNNKYDVSNMTSILKTLHSCEVSLTGINVKMCERDLTQEEEKRKQTLRNRVKKITDQLGFQVKFNQDPRGFAIRFILPSGRYNSWDGETWGINW